MKTIIHIVGNRPQFIKLAVLYKELATDANINQEIIHTGQHYSFNMSDIFFAELKIPKPTLNFNINNNTTTIFVQEATEKLYQYFLQKNNTIVFVYGDTNTTLAAALAAKNAKLPLLHFEAGVRTYDNTMPEEINRVQTDKLAEINYCCTQKNYETMLAEGFDANKVIQTGDLMLDAFLKIEASKSNVVKTLKYIACTIHREANLSSKENLTQIIHALNKINNSIAVVMPIHPHTQKRILEYNINIEFVTTPALGYADMKKVLLDSEYVITDSGGASREAYFLKKKSLIIMDKPFWPEIIEQNCSLYTTANECKIIEKNNALSFLKPNFETNIFGNGNAAKNIHTHISKYLLV
ncbi:MAG: UDP-N-acetylglucosamine 2-epimerase (non-hydrolyzing) [Ferruginibacter sp.]|nr:UDP-N-acetylglucosamine 2-epimerase (non-hydrolyzing) [Ferruginibacter sp.]